VQTENSDDETSVDRRVSLARTLGCGSIVDHCGSIVNHRKSELTSICCIATAVACTRAPLLNILTTTTGPKVASVKILVTR
jgi:hypothetical protein